MGMPKEIEKWLVYDTKKFEYVFNENTPKHIKEEYYKFLKEIEDFVIDAK